MEKKKQATKLVEGSRKVKLRLVFTIFGGYGEVGFQ